MLQEAGFGGGIVNVITNAPDNAADVVSALIAHPAVRRINFTGSTGVGKIIAEQAAKTDETLEEIAVVSNEYYPLAQMTSRIYFSLESMSGIHYLYQYSLQ